MTWKEFLGLGIAGALVTTVGALLGHFLKEVVLARSFEKWKAGRSLAAVFRKYRDPIVLSGIELCHRIEEVCDDWPAEYLSKGLLEKTVTHPTRTAAVDKHYLRYRFVSSLYRLCACLAWLELFRQDIVFLDSGRSMLNRRFEQCVANMRADLADGQLNTAEDWERWTDALIFREEQRAIGEIMIGDSKVGRSVIGYAEFEQILLKDSARQKWVMAVARFMADPQQKKDFRRIRMQRLIVHLVDLVEVLAPERLSKRLAEGRRRYRPSVSTTLPVPAGPVP